MLGERGAAVVASLPRGELDPTRRGLLAADIPVLLVHGGLRPGGLAPDRTMTRFSWSLSGGEEQRAEPGMAPPEPRS